MNGATDKVQRSQTSYAIAAVLVIGLGLLWRSNLFPLSHGLSKYGGDGLWALVVFLCSGVVFNRSTTMRIVVIAVSFSWFIEFLQLYEAPWINSMRNTLLGALVLGSTFNAPDLLAYLVGILFGAFADYYLNRPKTQS